MLLALIIILILIWAAVVWSIYWSFMVFYSNFSESENYHKAYYTAISALERWELVVKQHQPWYKWFWWLKLWVATWNNSDFNTCSDSSLTDFSYLWKYEENQVSVLRNVNSRTSRIPNESGWNVETMLAANDSKYYNMMNYENAEVFLLYIDTSTNPYEKSTSLINSAPSKIEWVIRLPKKLLLSWWFSTLDEDNSLIWRSESIPGDDAIIDRQIRWDYYTGWEAYPFTIYSTQNTDRSTVHNNKDSIFRESDINNNNWLSWLIFKFDENSWNPISNTIGRKNLDKPVTVISQKENEIKNLNKHFKKLFSDSSKVQLRFNLLNLLQDINRNKVYPFLEYYIDFWGYVSDKYFTINGEWSYLDYQVNLIRKKPTVNDTVLSNFTSIIE